MEQDKGGGGWLNMKNLRKIMDAVRRLHHEDDGFATCPPGAPQTLRAREYAGGPQIGELFMKIPGNAATTAVGDVYSGKLQFPATFLMMAAVGTQGSAGDPGILPTSPYDIMVHFRPFGLQYTVGGQPLNVTFNTSMPWFNLGGKIVGRWLKVSDRTPFQEFWVDSGGAAAQTNITWIYSKDIDYFANFANQS